jgi:acetyltransferase-like isoleucine patch superfamily enzyme
MNDYWKSYLKHHGYLGIFNILIWRLRGILTKISLAECGHLTLQSGCQISGGKNIYIGSLTAGKNCKIEVISEFIKQKFNSKLKIGMRVSFGSDVHVGCANEIDIGNDVLIGSYVTIIDHDHGTYSGGSDQLNQLQISPALRPLKTAPIAIGNRVHIGERVVILKGVTIGEGSVIGAGSIVTGDVSKNSVVAGNPARIIRAFN